MRQAGRSASRSALLAAGLVRLGAFAIDRVPPGAAQRWRATNYRGKPVTLLVGPVVAGSALLAGRTPAACRSRSAAALAPAVAAVGAVAAGRYDDVVGARPEQRGDKGIAGHLAAARQGRVSAGAVKVLGIGTTSLVAVLLRGTRRPEEVALDASLLAGTANLVNLLDLRPGRAAKAVACASAVGAAAASASARPAFAALLGAALASLPEDLGERGMLGDAGANGLGILLGLAGVASTRPPMRVALTAAVAGLTLAGERVSFSAVIDRTRPLARIDGWGRRG